MEEIDKLWNEHMKKCVSCNIGKYNKRGGTTDAFHAFYQGYVAAQNVQKVK